MKHVDLSGFNIENGIFTGASTNCEGIAPEMGGT